MPRRLEYTFVKESFADEGFVLLEDKYNGVHTKLKYRCPNGHEHKVSFHNWQQGKRCPYCAGNAKLTMEFIRTEFKKEGYEVLSEYYINNSQKLEYICPNGHRHSISWHGWKEGNRCPYCSRKIKHTIEFARSEFEKEGYILLTKKYKNAYQKLEYLCSNGHNHNIVWSSWRQGHRCPECASINNSGKNHYNWKGGIKTEPYCDAWADKEYKSDIKVRDNNKCQNPDCWQTTDRLTIHHIDYDKQNCHPSNLITLCNSCNSRANKDREWHKEFYRNIIKKKYNFKEV